MHALRSLLLDLARLLHAAAVGLRAAAGALGDDGDGDDLMATRVRE